MSSTCSLYDRPSILAGLGQGLLGTKMKFIYGDFDPNQCQSSTCLVSFIVTPHCGQNFFSTWQDISCNILVKSSLLNASFRSTFPRTNYYIVLLPNSRPPNSLSSQIHGFISVSKKLLIHGFIRKTPPNSLLYD